MRWSIWNCGRSPLRQARKRSSRVGRSCGSVRSRHCWMGVACRFAGSYPNRRASMASAYSVPVRMSQVHRPIWVICMAWSARSLASCSAWCWVCSAASASARSVSSRLNSWASWFSSAGPEGSARAVLSPARKRCIAVDSERMGRSMRRASTSATRHRPSTISNASTALTQARCLAWAYTPLLGWPKYATQSDSGMGVV